MVASLAACGNKQESNTPSGGEQPANNQGNTPSNTPVEEDDEPVVLHFADDLTNFETMDVEVTTYNNVFQVSDLVMETLVGKDPETLDTNFPLLTGAPTVSDDGLVYTFELREGIKMQDGTIMDSDDVVATFNRIFAPETMSPQTWALDMIKGANAYMNGEVDVLEGVQKIDDRHFTIELEYPYYPLVASLSMSVFAIFSKEAYEQCLADGKAWGIDVYVGSGPYCFDGYVAGEQVTLSKFEDYNGIFEVGNCDQIIIHSMTMNTALLEFEAGTIDVANLSVELTPDYQNNPEFADNVQYQDFFGLSALVLNQSLAPTDDVRVREAIALCINRPSIANDYYNGAVTPAYSFLPPGIPGYDDKMTCEYNVQRAKELLAEAGYPNGITIPTQLSAESDLYALYKEWLAEAGITLDIQLVDRSTQVATMTSGNANFWQLLWYADYIDADEFLYGIFHSSVATYFSTGMEEGSEFDQRVTAARSLTDNDERTKIYDELNKEICYERWGVIPLYYPGQYYLVSDRVKSGCFMKKDFLYYLAGTVIEE